MIAIAVVGRSDRALIVEDFRRQQVDVDARHAIARREDDGALDDVAQLADVAGPVMRLQRRHRFLRDAQRRDPPLGREAGEEMADQLGNVLAPLAQRRQAHRHDIEAVEEILAEATGGDLVLQVARGRRQNPNVDLHRPLAADPVIALVGEHAQDLRLRRQRHVGDFVEEQRAAMRMFEQARADDAVGSRCRTVPLRRARGSSSPPKGR